ncbi:9424_t:CDS:2 [Entrophospora sp. SA101]|nr:9424_t:CDS:2 [Entrophospora sp. SA101]
MSNHEGEWSQLEEVLAIWIDNANRANYTITAGNEPLESVFELPKGWALKSNQKYGQKGGGNHMPVQITSLRYTAETMLEELNIMVEEEGQISLTSLCNISISSGCEHNFSTLKWIYGDYQTKLSIYKVEAMCKICSYYISNLDKELKYYGKGLNINEIRNNIFDSSVTDNFFDEKFNSNFRSDIINEQSESLRNINVGNMSYDPISPVTNFPVAPISPVAPVATVTAISTNIL